METRFDYVETAPGLARALVGVEEYLHACGLEASLLTLVRLRASQINGCAVCVDIRWDENTFGVVTQWKELREFGESERRFRGLDAWREVSILVVLLGARTGRSGLDRGSDAGGKHARSRQRLRRRSTILQQ